MALALAACQEATLSRNDPNRGRIPLSQSVMAELDAKGVTRSSPILVRIFKEEAELEVWKKDRNGRFVHFKTYPICKYSGELGPKIREGDRQAPEGFYMVGPGQMNPQSSYFLSFNLGFPNAFDRSFGRTGSHLMVHGDCSSRGCYAMTDEAIAEVYALARDVLAGGQEAFQVQAYPFRMTPRNFARHRNNPHMAFWKNLKQGHDHFEVTRLEPQVDVCERRYVFNAVSPNASFADAETSRQMLFAGAAQPREMRSQVNDPWQGISTRGVSPVNRAAPVTTTVPAPARNVSVPATPVPDSLRQPVTTVPAVTRAAPTTRATAVSGASRPTFQAASRCPAYVVPPAIRDAVAQKHARDMAQIASLSGSLAAAPARSGIDGGTHRNFAPRFADRRVRVGSTEPVLPFLDPGQAVTGPQTAEATPGPTPSETVALVTAPVPRPSPLRTAAAGTPTPGTAQATPVAAQAAAAEPPATGNWLTRLVSSATPSAEPAPAAAPAQPSTTAVAPPARSAGRPATAAPAASTSIARSAAAPATIAAPSSAAAAQPAAPGEPAAPAGNWFTRFIGTAPAAPAPSVATPVPAPRPQASAGGSAQVN